MFRTTRLALVATAATGALLSGCATGRNIGAPDAGSSMSSGMSGETVMVGGAAMYPNRTIVQNAVNSRDHTTLVAAVQAAGLADTLNGPGPFTVFAPTNAAFQRLPAGTVESALRPENRALLTSVLTYHVVPGRVLAADLMRLIQAGGGSATLTTVQGGTLTARMSGGNVIVTDAGGRSATVTQADVLQSNGVIHVTDTVFLPG